MPAIDGTSKLSAHLKWGEIHPRTLLTPLGESKAHDTFRKEIAWREFYADVLFNNPDTDVDYYTPRFSQMRYDKPEEKFNAWKAGCGSDASPYYRIFNPIEQGKRFDAKGDYIRTYIPELAHLTPEEIHEPWLYPNGYSRGYIVRIVDHATERLEALARLKEIKADKPLDPRA